MRRIPMFAGNWKMHKTVGEAVATVKELAGLLQDVEGVDVVVCPPFTALYAVREALVCRDIKLGAQDVFWEEQGAYTGEVSPGMLKEVGCCFAIIGHSERRQYFRETNEQTNHKVRAVLRHGMRPILCVGETLEERETGQTEARISEQLTQGLAGLQSQDVAKSVIAYEPIWAIGTGRSATTAQANEVAAYIRGKLAEMFGAETAAQTRILYGGSVKPEIMRELMFEPDIDGVLVGGASLDAATFARIVNF